MARHISKTLVSSLTIASSGTEVIDIDLDSVDNLQFLVSVTYPSTAATTGVAINLKGGFGGGDPTLVDGAGDPLPYKVGGSSVPTFSDNVEAVVMATMPTNQGSPTTKRTNFYLNEIGIRWPRWVRMELTNNDTASTATISIKLDM